MPTHPSAYMGFQHGYDTAKLGLLQLFTKKKTIFFTTTTVFLFYKRLITAQYSGKIRRVEIREKDRK